MGDVDYNGDEMLVGGADDGYDGGPMELDIVDMSGGDIAMGDAGAVADAVERLVKEELCRARKRRRHAAVRLR